MLDERVGLRRMLGSDVAVLASEAIRAHTTTVNTNTVDTTLGVAGSDFLAIRGGVARVAEATTELANTFAVATTRARQAHLLVAALTSPSWVAEAFAEQAQAVAVTRSRATMDERTTRNLGTSGAGISGLTDAFVVNADTVHRAATARLLFSMSLELGLVHHRLNGLLERPVTGRASPARHTEAMAMSANTVLTALGGAGDFLLAGRATVAGVAQALAKVADTALVKGRGVARAVVRATSITSDRAI